MLTLAELKITHLTGEVDYLKGILKDNNITYDKYRHINEKEEKDDAEKEKEKEKEQEDSIL